MVLLTSKGLNVVTEVPTARTNILSQEPEPASDSTIDQQKSQRADYLANITKQHCDSSFQQKRKESETH